MNIFTFNCTKFILTASLFYNLNTIILIGFIPENIVSIDILWFIHIHSIPCETTHIVIFITYFHYCGC